MADAIGLNCGIQKTSEDRLRKVYWQQFQLLVAHMMFDKNLAVSMVGFQQMYYTYNDNLTRTLSNTNDVTYYHYLTVSHNKSTPNIPFFSGK